MPSTMSWGLAVATKRRWHTVTCFNCLGINVAMYVRKVSKASVQGRLHYTKWTDEDGADRYSVEVVAETVDFLTSSKSDSTEG